MAQTPSSAIARNAGGRSHALYIKNIVAPASARTSLARLRRVAAHFFRGDESPAPDVTRVVLLLLKRIVLLSPRHCKACKAAFRVASFYLLRGAGPLQLTTCVDVLSNAQLGDLTLVGIGAISQTLLGRGLLATTDFARLLEIAVHLVATEQFSIPNNGIGVFGRTGQAGLLPVSDALSFVSPLLSAANASLAEAIVVPALGCALRASRDAELVLCISAGLLIRLRCDLSWIEDLGEAVRTNALSSYRGVRAGAANLAHALALRCGSDAAALMQLASSCCQLLGPQKAQVPLWQGRMGLLLVLGGMARGITERLLSLSPEQRVNFALTAEQVAASVLDTLCSAKGGVAAAEAHELTRRATVRCVGRWLPLLFADSASVRSLPSNVAGFLTAGLDAAGAGGNDGYAEAIYLGLTAGSTSKSKSVDFIATTQFTHGAPAPFSAGFSAALSLSLNSVEGNVCNSLVSLLARTAATALATTGPQRKAAAAACPGTTAPFGAVFALASLTRLAAYHSEVADFCSAPSFPALMAPPASLAVTKSGAKRDVSLPAAPTKSSVIRLSPTLCVFDFFTHRTLASSVLFHSSVVGCSGRSRDDVEAVTPASHAALDACACLLLSRVMVEQVKLFESEYVSAVTAHLSGSTPVDNSSPFFSGIASLLVHAQPSLRRGATSVVLNYYERYPYDAMSICLAHALWHRALASDVLAPSCSSSPSPTDTGIGDGPQNEAALDKFVLRSGNISYDSSVFNTDDVPQSSPGIFAGGVEADEGRLLGYLSESCGSDTHKSPRGGAAMLPIAPSPQRFQAAMAAVFAPSAAVNAAALLPAALFLCSHPAVSGCKSDDANGFGRTGLSAWAVGQGILALDTFRYVSSSRLGSGALPAHQLWKRTLLSLQAALIARSSGHPVQVEAIPAQRPLHEGFEVVKILSPPAAAQLSVDAMLQSPEFGASILAFLGLKPSAPYSLAVSPWGLLSPSHTLRTMSAQACSLLAEGVAWIEESTQSMPSNSVTASSLTDICGGSGSGARRLIVYSVLPALLSTLGHFTKLDGLCSISSDDAVRWRSQCSTFLFGDGRDQSPDDAELLRQARVARWFRVRSDRLKLLADAESDAGASKVADTLPDSFSESASVWGREENWVLVLKSEMEERKRSESRDAAARSAIKGGGSGKGVVRILGPEGSGSKTLQTGTTVSGKGGQEIASKGGNSSLGSVDSISRAQEAYSDTVGALFALSMIVRGFRGCLGGNAASRSTFSSRSLIPSLMPTLLPLLGSQIVQAHAAFCVEECVRYALAGTTIAEGAPGAPIGLPALWTRALLVVQAAHGSGFATASHLPLGTYSSSTRKANPDSLTLPLVALFDEGDACGASGCNLVPHVSLLQRLLNELAPRIVPRGQPGGLPGHVSSDTVSEAEADSFRDDGGGGQVCSLSAAAASRIRPAPLPASAYYLLFPILRACLTSRPPLPIVPQALAIMAAQVDAQSSEAASVDPSLISGCLAGSESGDERVLLLECSSAEPALIPLGPAIADGSGSREFAGAGVCSAWKSFSQFAASLSFQSAPSHSAAGASKVADSVAATADYLSLRLLRESAALTLLHVIRTHPRSIPSPDSVLLDFVRGRRVYANDEVAGDSSRFLTVLSSSANVEDRLRTLTLGETGPLVDSAGLLSPFAHVRASCLAALSIILSVHTPRGGLRFALHRPCASDAPSSNLWHAADRRARNSVSRAQNVLISRLWLAIHDDDEENAAVARHVWQQARCELFPDFPRLLLPLLQHSSVDARRSSSRALASAARLMHPGPTTDLCICLLIQQHEAFADPSCRSLEAAANVREALFSSLAALADAGAMLPQHIPLILPFLINKGLADESLAARQQALIAGKALVSLFGSAHARLILPVCETFLDQGESSSLATAASTALLNAQREAVAVLLGSAARFLPPGDVKTPAILKLLVATLDTPSEPVQRAVAQCLPPLFSSLALSDSGNQLALNLCTHLRTKLFSKMESFAVRRGAAFGLGGALGGLGLPAILQSGVLTTLETAATEPKDNIARQGAMMAFECLCESFGVLFEPFVPRVLPTLLRSVGDQNREVQEAAVFASKAVMAILTSHGVRLVMPSVVKGLSETSWRSKQASIQLLGSMAFCAPRMLSQCLPGIVPRLVEAFEDPHPNVQKAGKEALEDIGKVIRNPEIRALASILREAVSDPSNKTKDALTALSLTDFVHAVDAPSIALVVPILRRGLQERVTSVKIQAATIAGNMCALVAEPRDLVPYLPQILPPLRRLVSDPIPDVRACTAKALGSLVRGLGLGEMPDLVPWLIQGLSSEASTVERSGSAQGLVNVLHAMGEPALSRTIAQLLPLADSDRAEPREGFLWVCVFLPRLVGPSFRHLLPSLFPLVVKSLADDVELVRDVGTRCSKTIVSAHGKADPDLVVPVLEDGLCAAAWRVRQASVALSGQLLMEIANMPQRVVVAGNSAGEDDGGASDEDEWASESEAGLSDAEREAESAARAREAAFTILQSDDLDSAALAVGARGGKEPRHAGPSSGGGEDVYSPSQGSWRAAVTVGGGKKDELAAVEPIKRRKKGERGVFDADAHISMPKKSAKARQLSAAKLAVLEAAGLVLGQKQRASDGDSSGGESEAKEATEPPSRPKNQRSAPAPAQDLSGATLLAEMDSAARAQVHVLGLGARSRLLALLYLTRSDTSQVVRQASLSVWKAVVPNSPRTLREVLPALTTILVRDLASESDERRLVASRCLGDVVRKLGDRVLPEVIPVLRRGLSDSSAGVRTGVCIGLAEVVEAASRSQIEDFVGLVVPALRDALCDADAGVREAASRAFTVLQRAVGSEALDGVLPSLLADVEGGDEESNERERAIAGLQAIVASRTQATLPAVLPLLLAPPLTLGRARALAAVAAAAASVLHHHILSILPPIVQCLAGEEEKAILRSTAERARAEAQILQTSQNRRGKTEAFMTSIALLNKAAESAEAIAANCNPPSAESVSDRMHSPLGDALGSVLCAVLDSGVAWTLQETVKYLSDPAPFRRAAGAFLVQAIVSGRASSPPSSSSGVASIATQAPLMLKELLARMQDDDEFALRCACDALAALAAALPVEEAATHLDFIRSCLASLSSFDKVNEKPSRDVHLPGFSLPKIGGLDALLPIYQRALLHGSSEARESAALGIGELVVLSSESALKPLWVKLTGPLIRVAADKFPWAVKAAILSTLALVVSRGGQALRPFQPQLQASFVKALADPAAAVRRRGAEALGQLVALTPRVDALIGELVAASEAAGPGGVSASVCDGLLAVFLRAGERVAAPVRTRTLDVLLALALNKDDEATRHAAAAAVASCLRYASAEESASIVAELCLNDSTLGEDVPESGSSALDPTVDGKCASVLALLRFAPGVAATHVGVDGVILHHISLAAGAKQPAVRESAAIALGFALSHACRPAADSEAGAEAEAPRVLTAPRDSDFSPDTVRAFQRAQPILLPLLVRMFADPSADVRKQAILAARHIARKGVSFSQESAASSASYQAVRSCAQALLPLLVAIVSKDSPNHVLSYEADRALVHFLGFKKSGAAHLELGRGVLAGVDTATARFLAGDYGRKTLRRRADEVESDDERVV